MGRYVGSIQIPGFCVSGLFVIWGSFQTDVKHAAFLRIGSSQSGTRSKAGEHVVYKEYPGKGPVCGPLTVGLYPEICPYLLGWEKLSVLP